jgi:hypothetical protein
MIDPNNLKLGQIEAKLKLKQFVLIKNTKENCDKWSKDISLVERVDENGIEEIFKGIGQHGKCIFVTIATINIFHDITFHF